MSEIWKQVLGYEGLYEVSSYGRVNSLGNHNSKRKEKILKPGLRGKGYKHVILAKDKQAKSFSVHRLVATSFIPNPLNLETVNHRNKVKTDNNVENLEWMTPQQNVEHGQSKSYSVKHQHLGEFCFFNVSKFIREHKLARSHFYDLLKGRKNRYKGWTIS